MKNNLLKNMAIVPSEASSYTKALCKILDNINIGTGNKDK